MKQFLTAISVLLIGFFLFAGCSSTPEMTHDPAKIAEEFEGAPEWVKNEGSNIEGGLAAVGSAKIGKAGVGFARNNAKAMARNELARQIQLKVKDLVKNFTQQIGVDQNQTVDKVGVQASKQVTKQSLSGSRTQDSWISSNGTFYTLMVLDTQSVKQHVKDSVETSMKKEKALWQQYQAEKGWKDLEKEIEKEFEQE